MFDEKKAYLTERIYNTHTHTYTYINDKTKMVRILCLLIRRQVTLQTQKTSRKLNFI